MTKIEQIRELDRLLELNKKLAGLPHSLANERKELLKSFKYRIVAFCNNKQCPEVYIDLPLHKLDYDLSTTVYSDNLKSLVSFIVEERAHLLYSYTSFNIVELSLIIPFFVSNYKIIIQHEYSDKLIELLESLQECNLEIVKQIINSDARYEKTN